MSKVVVSEFLTLDGVMEAPGGEPGHPHSGWVFDFMSEEQLQYKLQEVLEAESLLIGRVTYESFAGAWPERSGEFADKMNAMPKNVVSTTLKDPKWNNTTVIGDNVVGEIRRLQQHAGGPILVGGSRTLVQALMEHELVDEWRLMIFPVVLGSGRAALSRESVQDGAAAGGHQALRFWCSGAYLSPDLPGRGGMVRSAAGGAAADCSPVISNE